MKITFNEHQMAHVKKLGLALTLFFIALALTNFGATQALAGPQYHLYLEFVLFLIPYLIAGSELLGEAWENIRHGEIFDEAFLMTVATVGAFALVLFPDSKPHMAEGAAVMLFFQIGEFFEHYAVEQSHSSIAEMMNIAPEHANLLDGDKISQVAPEDVVPGSIIMVKPGERVPLDGIVIDGSSSLDTAALTGESALRAVTADDEVISGCINISGALTIKTTKPYTESTVARILDLVEHASEKKARTEKFITRFARVYTPAVVISAALIALIPPLMGMGGFAQWIERGLIFLVVSCPCALVISVPLSFFGGLGGASRHGILIKGGNYLEALAHLDTVVFDKTGTLTQGDFTVSAIEAEKDCGISEDKLLWLAAHLESFSNHPVALSICKAYTGTINQDLVSNLHEIAGKGLSATVDSHDLYAGNAALMSSIGIDVDTQDATCDTLIYLATSCMDGSSHKLLGTIHITDALKPEAAQTIERLKGLGIDHCVMLTGDNEKTAAHVAGQLGITQYAAELLPQDKVSYLENLLNKQSEKSTLAFCGDGINDAPVLMRADVGIAMGAMGSDAAIEAADVVLMDDNPTNIASAVLIARRTMSIVWQNIIFALGVKFGVLILAAFGVANMWLAVFADVGVAFIAVLNAMRAMNTKTF